MFDFYYLDLIIKNIKYYVVNKKSEYIDFEDEFEVDKQDQESKLTDNNDYSLFRCSLWSYSFAFQDSISF